MAASPPPPRSPPPLSWTLPSPAPFALLLAASAAWLGALYRCRRLRAARSSLAQTDDGTDADAAEEGEAGRKEEAREPADAPRLTRPSTRAATHEEALGSLLMAGILSGDGDEDEDAARGAAAAPPSHGGPYRIPDAVAVDELFLRALGGGPSPPQPRATTLPPRPPLVLPASALVSSDVDALASDDAPADGGVAAPAGAGQSGTATRELPPYSPHRPEVAEAMMLAQLGIW